MNYYHHDVDGHGGHDDGYHDNHVEFTGYHDAPDGNNQRSYIVLVVST